MDTGAPWSIVWSRALAWVCRKIVGVSSPAFQPARTATAVTLQRQKVVGVAQTGIATAPADFESAAAKSYSTNKAEADPSCD